MKKKWRDYAHYLFVFSVISVVFYVVMTMSFLLNAFLGGKVGLGTTIISLFAAFLAFIPADKWAHRNILHEKV